ncbi:hypothetical protein [Luteolibacter sp. LG18]|uniref:hypothetical protein n=1 Tax=Luteolibacter sp. LG18 TaxID=2819286 RepID=UPI002B2A82B3|nr:hypothetical protein llg_36060 [Luteolibacter sp. LG18]
MRLILIIGGLAAALFFGLRSFDKVLHPKAPAPVQQEQLPKLPTLPAPPAAEVPPLLRPAAPPLSIFGTPPPSSVENGCHRLYVFQNRDVPPAPFDRANTIGARPDDRGVEISVDHGSNSWLIRGPVIYVEQVMSIAKGLDIVQDQLDVDFLLIALSEDYVRSWGLSVLMRDGASYLSAFQLEPSGLSLTLSHDAFSLTFSAEDSTGSVRVVSAPVVRAVTGEKWEFSADTQVPVPTLQRSEGVVSTAFEYRKVGLGLSGTLNKAPGGKYRAHIEQRNGTVDLAPKDASTPPQLREQVLKTSAVLEPGRWSCIGGVRSWRVEQEKGFFGKTDKETQELLLVFARPRFQLAPVPRAMISDAAPDALTHLAPFGPDPLATEGSPLLPPKDWKRSAFPDGVEPKGLPLPAMDKGPRSK